MGATMSQQQIDEATGARLVVFKDGNGTEHKWTMLSPAEFLRLSNQLVSQQRAKLEHNLKTAGVPWEKAYEMLAEFDKQEVSKRDAMHYGVSDAGQPLVLRMGMECEKPDATDADVRGLKLKPGEASRIVGALMWLNMDAAESPEKPSAGGGDPLPASAAAA
jgi:hypothetical protein